ncbi:endonuclease 4 [Artemisia annua]|uniref:Aspergillus nuclease S1 n=1 Tax=Artemisia annua TaxID=35608 RepID=A0A2U1P0N4_ARTAN|nr:endonuclease 4 [Artemisia annua]
MVRREVDEKLHDTMLILKVVNCNISKTGLEITLFMMDMRVYMDAGIRRNYVILGVFELLLTEDATKAVKELLPESEGNLSAVCSWPDEIKWMNKWRWTSELHYVDTPDFRCNYDYDIMNLRGTRLSIVKPCIFLFERMVNKFSGSVGSCSYCILYKILIIDRLFLQNQSLLTEEATKAVKELLPESEGNLSAVCSWPDEIKWMNKWRWTSELHYVDTPDFRCNYDYDRDCHDSSGVKDRCVTGAIYNYTEQLVTGYNASNSVTNWDCHDSSGVKDRCVTGAIYNYTEQLVTGYNASNSVTNCKRHCQSVINFLHYMKNENSQSQITDNLTEALMFLSHYIGDVHQPLHVSFTTDEGGNTITVRWYKRKTNLHHVWDSDIIESAMKTFYDKDLNVMISAIEKNMTTTWSNDISSWANCTSAEEVCPDPWASESIKCSCNYAYRNATPGSTLGDEYFLSRLPIVEMRLAQGGVRLAATLNQIFTPYASVSQKLAYFGNIQPKSHTI